uniref:C2H2-type domain-containing protein n=1 Tax=Ascaris lumbricoides TaxID=6252 RepID=A0A0M3IEN2_ASCLU
MNAGLPYYMCPFCCVTFTEKEVYQAHIPIHSQPQSMLCTNYGTLICGKGKKMHNDKGRLLECSLCEEVFAEEALYNGHMQIHSPSNKLCERCGKSMLCTNYGTLICGKGKKMHNDKGRLLECSLCEEVFAEEALYNGHMQIHSPSNKLCERCGKVFVSTFDLNLHYGVHSGFLYDCKQCGRCFDSKNTLSQHQKTHRTLSVEVTTQETDGSSDSKSSEGTSTSSFRGNTYITSLLSQYSSKKTRGNVYRRSNGKKSAIRLMTNSKHTKSFANEQVINNNIADVEFTDQDECDDRKYEMTNEVSSVIPFTIRTKREQLK